VDRVLSAVLFTDIVGPAERDVGQVFQGHCLQQGGLVSVTMTRRDGTR
jgi:hypothetical protein